MAVLLSSDTALIVPLGTIDQYHLSDQLDTFDTSQYYWPGEATDAGKLSVASGLSFVTTGSSLIQALAPPNLALSYFNDFYNRIHFSIKELSLGNVLSQQIYTLYVWNAWTVSRDLSTVNTINLDDVFLNLGISIPYTFTPLQEISGNVTVVTDGTPSIDGYYEFIFNSETHRLNITGQRIVVWFFVPETEFEEAREWNTDIIDTRKTEERFVNREIPRAVITYNYNLLNEKNYSLVQTVGRKTIELPVGIPLWTEAVGIGTVTPGTTVINLDTTYLEFEGSENTGMVILFESFDKYEIIETTVVTNSSIALKLPTELTLNNCWIAPVKLGFINNGISITRDSGKFKASLNITIVNPYYEAIWPDSDEYLGLKVLPVNTITSGGLNEKITRALNVFDSISGGIANYTEEDYNRAHQQIRLKAQNAEERYKVKRQFDYLQGKFQEFWLPSFNTDLIPAGVITPGGSSLKVEYAAWSSFSLNHIRVIGNVTEYFEVTNVADNLDGTETLTLSPASAGGITNIKSIQTVTKVRLDSDRIEYSHRGKRLMLTTSPVIEVV